MILVLCATVRVRSAAGTRTANLVQIWKLSCRRIFGNLLISFWAQVCDCMRGTFISLTKKNNYNNVKNGAIDSHFYSTQIAVRSIDYFS